MGLARKVEVLEFIEIAKAAGVDPPELLRRCCGR
jgi:hypothetical protein